MRKDRKSVVDHRSTSSSDCHRPPPVTPGDRIGVAALSGAVATEALEAGLDELRCLGFEPVLASNLRASAGASRCALFAGSDDQRLEGFHDLIRTPRVRAICFARGGHGVLRLLPAIDWELIARRPLAYLGYSDVTPLLLEIVRRARLVTFHGPMVAVDLARGLDPRERQSLLAALAAEPLAPYPVEALSSSRTTDPSGELENSIVAPLYGGCLSMLTSTLGTAFAPSWGHSIVFLEDVAEPLYRRDRMLTQLGLAGCLAGCQALVLGQFDAGRGEESPADEKQWAEIARELGEHWGFPVFRGLTVGHAAPNLTLPLGAPARLDLTGSSLTVE